MLSPTFTKISITSTFSKSPISGTSSFWFIILIGLYTYNKYIWYIFNTFKAFFGQAYMSLIHNVYNYIKKNN